MSWPGLPRSGRSSPASPITPESEEEFDDCTRWTFETRDVMKLGILFNGAVGVVLAVPIVRYILSPVIRERRPGYESWLSLGPLDQFPAGETRLATYRNPVGESIGWGNREYSLLGASCGRREVPGVCDQLRASGVPGPLVPAVRPVHVPLPRRRLLFGRFPRLGTSASAACLNIATRWSRGTC